jgi:hypothetical protein
MLIVEGNDMGEFDLGKYWGLFDKALRARYRGRDFTAEFKRIKDRFKPVGSGDQLLTINDVMSIFEKDLPFVEDWTKPDETSLAERMKSEGAGQLIKDMGDRWRTAGDEEIADGYDLKLLKQVSKLIHCFRELSITALVLQHVYPERFAMCNYNLASLLYVSAPTVPKFYIRYCKELRKWSQHRWPTAHALSVEKAEYALWTWYRFAHEGMGGKAGTDYTDFMTDHWVGQQRAEMIAESLYGQNRLDLARSYVNTDPTVAAIIAWREFAVKVREMVDSLRLKITGDDRKKIWTLIEILETHNKIPPHWKKDDLEELWRKRNKVMKEGYDDITLTEATRIVNQVEKFIRESPKAGDPWR